MAVSRAVIASEAKQSIAPQMPKHGLLRRYRSSQWRDSGFAL